MESGHCSLGESQGEGSSEESSAETTVAGCPGEENACGGCDTLPGMPGESCLGCDDKAWTCDGTEQLLCEGFDPAADVYYPDQDGDGFGLVEAFESKDLDGDGVISQGELREATQSKTAVGPSEVRAPVRKGVRVGAKGYGDAYRTSFGRKDDARIYVEGTW